MTQKIRSQAAKFWDVLASAETLTTYRQAIDVTVQILKEGLLLLWLVLCLGLVVFDWGSTRAIAAGKGFRSWISSMEKADSNQLASDAGKKLISAGKASVAMTVSQARQQLGLPEKQEPLALSASPSPASPLPTDLKPSSSPPTSSPPTSPPPAVPSLKTDEAAAADDGEL